MEYRSVVVDTNVVVAGLLTRVVASPTTRILDRMLVGDLRFLVSLPLLAEYRSVLLRERIRARHGLVGEEIDAILARIVTNAIVREPAGDGERAPSRQDQHLWDLLSTEPHSILVTGDRLLIEEPPFGIRVLSPSDFVGAD